jgi:hypothetical protein
LVVLAVAHVADESRCREQKSSKDAKHTRHAFALGHLDLEVLLCLAETTCKHCEQVCHLDRTGLQIDAGLPQSRETRSFSELHLDGFVVHNLSVGEVVVLHQFALLLQLPGAKDLIEVDFQKIKIDFPFIICGKFCVYKLHFFLSHLSIYMVAEAILRTQLSVAERILENN